MTDYIKALREALDAGPTDGPWIAAGPSFGEALPGYCNEVVTDRADEDECEIVYQAPSYLAAEVTVDMHYIAAANPSVIRELLDRLEAADRQLQEKRDKIVELHSFIRQMHDADESYGTGSYNLTDWLIPYWKLRELASMKEQQP